MSGLFIEGVRVSTIATAGAFGVVGLLRGGDRRALLAAAAWLTGFETAYQLTSLAMGTNAYPGAVPFLALPGLLVVPVVTRRYKVVPWRPMVLVTAAVWVLWIVTGFHANQHETPDRFSVWTEVLNESAKTVWALAYLTGLSVPRACRRGRRRSQGREAGCRLPRLPELGSKRADHARDLFQAPLVNVEG